MPVNSLSRQVAATYSYADRLGYRVDNGIRYQVAILNLLGFHTVASCQGHENWGLPHPWIDVDHYGHDNLPAFQRMTSLAQEYFDLTKVNIIVESFGSPHAFRLQTTGTCIGKYKLAQEQKEMWCFCQWLLKRNNYRLSWAERMKLLAIKLAGYLHQWSVSVLENLMRG